MIFLNIKLWFIVIRYLMTSSWRRKKPPQKPNNNNSQTRQPRKTHHIWQWFSHWTYFSFRWQFPEATSTPDILIYSWHSWFPPQNFRHPTPGTKHSHHRHIWCVFLVHQHSPRWRDWCMLQRFSWEWSHFTPHHRHCDPHESCTNQEQFHFLG